MKRILWVDDDMFLLGSMIEVLESGDHYRVFTAKDIQGAEKILNDYGIDLLILDILFPCEDEIPELENKEHIGLYYLKYLRQRGINLPVIVFSVAHDDNLRYEIRKLGILNYLIKGKVLPDQLKAEIDKAFI